MTALRNAPAGLDERLRVFAWALFPCALPAGRFRAGLRDPAARPGLPAASHADVYDDPRAVEPHFRQALALEDLTDHQRSELSDLPGFADMSAQQRHRTLVLASIVGTWLGTRLLGRMRTTQFRLAFEGVLGLLGLRLLVSPWI